jgi:hypothetical protein
MRRAAAPHCPPGDVPPIRHRDRQTQPASREACGYGVLGFADGLRPTKKEPFSRSSTPKRANWHRSCGSRPARLGGGGWRGVRLAMGGWCPPGGACWRRALAPAGARSPIRETTEALRCNTGVLSGNQRWFGLATVMTDVQSLPEQLDSAPPPRLLDRQGWSTLVAGSLLLLISFTTNYGDDNVSRFRRLPAHDQRLF